MRRDQARVVDRRLAAASALLLSIAACYSAAARPAEGPPTAHERTRITARELSGISVGTAYDVVMFRRPHFLRGRGLVSALPGVPHLPLVYANGLFLGGVETLRELPAREIREINFIDPWTADTRYPTRRHPRGAIEVVLGR